MILVMSAVNHAAFFRFLVVVVLSQNAVWQG